MEEEKILKTYNEGITAVITVVKDMSSHIDLLTGTVTNLNGKINGLNTDINGLNTEIVDLKATCAKQWLRLTELEARLNMNSNNSSKPPSSDGYRKEIKNSRQKSGKATGGQPGHEGRTLEKVNNPDKIVEDKTPSTCECGHNLEGIESLKKTRQVFDFPKPQIRVVEYVSNELVCPGCKKVHKTEFPAGVNHPTQYGENMQALMNYFTQYNLIPLGRAAEAIADITGQAVSQGTLVNAANRLSVGVDGTVEEIKKQLINSDVVHFDETGVRSEGKTMWMHTAGTEKLTHYAVHEKRGEEAAKAIGILPFFKGVAMHDHWKPYYCFKDCSHAECNSHNLRYLKDIVENFHQDWARNMASLLIETKSIVAELKLSGAAEMPREEIMMWQNRYHKIIELGILEDAAKSPQVLNKKGKPKKSKPLQLLIKLQQFDIETLAYLYDFDVDFDNNLAERDIRMQKFRQKISGCFRSADGANTFSRIRSYISTARKNGIGALDAIARAIKGQPFVPEA